MVKPQQNQKKITSFFPKIALSERPLTEQQNAAKAKLETLFSSVGWSHSYSSSTHREVARVATCVVAMVSLLQQFPVLASQKFGGNGKLPLAFFIQNNFGISLLETILRLNPKAVSSAQGGFPSLHHLACSLFNENTNPFKCETLCWLAAHCDDDNSVQVYQSIKTDKTNYHLSWYLALPSILHAFATKSNKVSFGSSSTEVPLFDCIVYLGLDKDILTFFMHTIPGEYDTLTLDRDDLAGLSTMTSNWESRYKHPHPHDSLHSGLVEFLLPRLKKLTWGNTEDVPMSGGSKTLSLLSKRTTLDALQYLKLSFPLTRLKNCPRLLAALKDILRAKPASLQLELVVDGSLDVSREDFCDADEVLTTMLTGMKENASQTNPIIQEMELRCVDDYDEIPWNLLEQFNYFVANIVLERCHLNAAGGKTNALREHDNIEDLNSAELVDGPLALTRICSRLSHLEDLFIDAKFEFMSRPSDQHSGFLPKPRVDLQMLTCLQIDLFDEFSSGTRDDVTSALVSALNVKTLRELSYQLDDEAESHELQSAPFCQALSENTGLVSLTVVGVRFLHHNPSAITSLFFDALKAKNTTLEVLKVWSYSEEGCFDIELEDALSLGFHEDCDYFGALGVQYFLCLNKIGRKALRDRDTTTTNDVVNILVKAQQMILPAPKRYRAFEDIVALQKSNSDSLTHLNAAFEILKKASPAKWSATRLNRLSLIYGVLRESPDLWCLQNAGAASPLGKRKRSRLDLAETVI